MQPITQAALQQIVSFLAPLFLPQTGGDVQAAWQAAHETLATYGATTDQQMRLAAQFIAFSLQALGTLGRALEPGVDARTALRLNGNANALNRAAMQAHRALVRSQAGHTGSDRAASDTPPVSRPESREDQMPTSSELADLLQFIQASDAAEPRVPPAAAGTIALSRQQRRAAERLARKALKNQPPARPNASSPPGPRQAAA